MQTATDAARADDAPHLGDARRRVVHERDDELRERGVEALVRPRQVLGRRLVHGDVGQPLAQRRDERRRRVGGGDLRAAAHELGGQRARAGADVEHAHAPADAGEVGEQRREPHRVAAHEVVVRDVEERDVATSSRGVVHVDEQRSSSVDDGDVETGDRVAQREPPVCERSLERRSAVRR